MKVYDKQNSYDRICGCDDCIGIRYANVRRNTGSGKLRARRYGVKGRRRRKVGADPQKRAARQESRKICQDARRLSYEITP